MGRAKRIEKARKAAAAQKRAEIMKPVIKPVQVRRPGEYVLEGVIYSDSPIAVINGKLLKAGGKIDGFVVKAIAPTEVELIKTEDNSIVTLKIR